MKTLWYVVAEVVPVAASKFPRNHSGRHSSTTFAAADGKTFGLFWICSATAKLDEQFSQVYTWIGLRLRTFPVRR